jgi:hypothetical protein
MGRIGLGVGVAFACLGATWASAESVLHTSDSHSTMGPGQGGWTMNFSTNKAFTSGSASVVTSSTNKVVDLYGVLGRYDLTGSRHWLFRPRSDADCVFVSIDTSAGDLWRPGCK